MLFRSCNCYIFCWLLEIYVIYIFCIVNSDTTKDVLIASTYVHLKCNKFAKYASDLPTVSPRILLSGPAGSASFSMLICYIFLCVFSFLLPNP